MSESVRTTAADGILEVVLDRPKANAIDSATSRALGRTFAAFRDDPALRVAIVTGGGLKFFSAGWDLKAAAEGSERPDSDYGVGGFGGLQELPDLNKPVIAALNGMAVGGGFELALSCDLILAAEHVRFALPEIAAGTLADAATIKLPRRIPHHVAMDLLLTGRWMDAAEAKGWGLVNEILPADVFCCAPARLLASWRTAHHLCLPRSRRPCAGPKACRSSRRWISSLRSSCRQSSGSTRATTSWKARAPLRRSASRCGAGNDGRFCRSLSEQVGSDHSTFGIFWRPGSQRGDACVMLAIEVFDQLAIFRRGDLLDAIAGAGRQVLFDAAIDLRAI